MKIRWPFLTRVSVPDDFVCRVGRIGKRNVFLLWIDLDYQPAVNQSSNAYTYCCNALEGLRALVAGAQPALTRIEMDAADARMSLRSKVSIPAHLLLRVSIEQSSSSLCFTNRRDFNDRIGHNQPCYGHGVESGTPSDCDGSKQQEWPSRRQWFVSRRPGWTTSGRYFLKIQPWTAFSYDNTTCSARWANRWLLPKWRTLPTVYFGKQRYLLHAFVTLTAIKKSRHQ